MATQTAVQRRRTAAAAHQAFMRDCPTSQLLDRLAEKWATLVLLRLRDGPRRYGELSRAVPGASPKMLTQTLRQLERDGLVDRVVTPAVPVRVDYALTALGRTLIPVVGVLKEWADAHIPEVAAARAAHDAATRAADAPAAPRRDGEHVA